MQFNLTTWADHKIKTAGVPIHGIDKRADEDGNLVPVINFRDEATPDQREQAQAILDACWADPAACEAQWQQQQQALITAEKAGGVVALFAAKLNAAGIPVTNEEIVAAMQAGA